MTERQYHITEYRVAGRRLGRHVCHDERSRDHPAEQAGKITAVSHASHGLPLNQGDVGSCTAEALCGSLNTDPDAEHLKGQEAGHVFTQDDAYRLYTAETQLEGHPWPGEDPGGTGLYVCKAAKQLGWITSYKHAFGLDHALKALVLRPSIWGVSWYTGFDSPDPETGIVTVNGTVRGGHEIVATEIILKDQLITGTTLTAPYDLVGFWQSWGSWGLNGTGRFYAGFSDLERLLSEDGDVTVPVP